MNCAFLYGNLKVSQFYYGKVPVAASIKDVPYLIQSDQDQEEV